MKWLDPKHLFNKAWRIKVFAYFFRNNPRSRYLLYNGFKHWIGLEDWKQVHPEVKNAWEASVNSFDKLYGLLSIFRMNNDRKYFLKQEKEKDQRQEPDTFEVLNDTVEKLKQCAKVAECLKEVETKKSFTAKEFELIGELVKELKIENDNVRSAVEAYINALASDVSLSQEKE